MRTVQIRAESLPYLRRREHGFAASRHARWINDMRLFTKTTESAPCEVEVSHCFDSLHAHVKFLNGAVIHPGDEVLIHGKPVMAPYGEVVREARTATITRASAVEQLWTRLKGNLALMELCEFSFSEEVSV